MPEPPCIFCFESTDFTREHVIAEAIHGSLILDDAVCRRCNSWLGTDVDAELVKLPETIDAFEMLKIPYDRDKVLNRHYEAVGSARDIEVHGHLTTEGFRFHPQVLADGSMIFPENQAWEALRKNLVREGAGTYEEIDDELANLRDAYDKAPVNEPVLSERFGRGVVKRSGSFDVKLNPRGKPTLTPAMAKIAYEFLFIIAGGRRLLAQENAEAVNALFDLINGQSSAAKCIRLAPLTEGFGDAHGIRFRRGTTHCAFRIILFGNVHHYLTTPCISEEILDEIKAAANQDVIGVEYQQRVTTGAKAFHALALDGKGIRLPAD